MPVYGLGAFAQGLSNGLNTGILLGNTIRMGQNRAQMKDAFAQAGKDRDASIVNDTLTQAGEQAAQGKSPDVEALQAQNQKSTPDVASFFIKNQLPDIMASLASQGDMKGLDSLQKWADGKTGRDYMNQFGQALKLGQEAMQTGDYSAFGQHTMRMFNAEGVGGKLTDFTQTKDSQGNPMLSFTYHPDDGDPQTVNMTPQESLEYVANYGNPGEAAKRYMARQTAADAAQAQLAVYRGKKSVDLSTGVSLEDTKQAGRERLAGINNAAAAQRLQDVNDTRLQIAASRLLAAGGANEKTARWAVQQVYTNNPNAYKFTPEQLAGEAGKFMESVQQAAQQGGQPGAPGITPDSSGQLNVWRGQ